MLSRKRAIIIISHLKMMVVGHIDKVSKYFGEYSAIFAIVGTGVTYLVGGWDKAIIALIALVGIDIITGCIKGFFVERDFTSKRLREGFGTKVMYILVIAVGNILDGVFFEETPLLRNLAVFFYIYVESMSILENLGNLGVPIPQKLVDGLGQVKENVGSFAKMKDGKFVTSKENADDSEGNDEKGVG